MCLLRVVPENGLLIKQREKLGLSQEEVAKRAGITLKQYQRYEEVGVCISSATSTRIADAVFAVLEIDTTAFMKGDYVFEPLPEDDPLNKIFGKQNG